MSIPALYHKTWYNCDEWVVFNAFYGARHMDKEAFEDLLTATPFHPFRIYTNGGQSYDVLNPNLVHQLKTQVFFAYPDSDRFTLIPLRNISSIDVLEQAA